MVTGNEHNGMAVVIVVRNDGNEPCRRYRGHVEKESFVDAMTRVSVDMWRSHCAFFRVYALVPHLLVNLRCVLGRAEAVVHAVQIISSLFVHRIRRAGSCVF